MADIGTLLVALGINTAPFTAGMAKSEAELKGFGSTASGVGSKASGAFSVVNMAALAAVGGVVAFGAESVNAARTFQSSMALIQTQAGAPAAEVANMQAGILAMASSVDTSPDQLAAGLYHIESAGIRGAQALDILHTAAEGAKVGNADLESVTNALLAEVNSGVTGVTSMSGAMGTLNAIVGAGNMRMQDLTDAFGTGVLSAAKVFGVSLQSVGAALADMTNQGIPATDAATRITSAIRLMAAPTSKAVKEFAGIGLSSSTLAHDLRSKGGILTAVEDLTAHMDKAGLSTTQQAALLASAFGGKQSLGILTLVGNVQKLKDAQDAVNKGAGSFGDAWAANQQTAQAHMDQFHATLDTLSVDVGMVLLPLVTDAMSALGTWLANNQTTIVSFATNFATGIRELGAVVGPAIAAVGAAWAAIPGPVKELIIGAFLANKVAKLVLGIDASSLASAGLKLGASFMGSITSAAGGLLGNAQDALGIRVFVTNMAEGGLGGGGAAGGALNAAEGAGAAGGGALAPALAVGLLPLLAIPLTAAIHTTTAQELANVAKSNKGGGAVGNDITTRFYADQKTPADLQAIKDQLAGPSLTALQGIKDSTSSLLASANPTLAALSDIKDGTTASAASMVGAMDDVRTQVATTGGTQTLAIDRLAAIMTMQSGSASQSSQHLARLGVHAFADGGTVPGIGPMLAVLHGGEVVIPPDVLNNAPAGPGLPSLGGIRSGIGQVIRLELHNHIEIAGQPLLEWIDTALFGGASGYSSGFMANPGVTGA